MKLLFYKWQGVAEEDAIKALRQMGVELEVFECVRENYDEDAGIRNAVNRVCLKESFDGLFSFNYFPILSKICEEKGMPYFSWVYDSPHLTLYSQTVTNSCNEIFLFDYSTYEEMRVKGRGNVHYLPLAVNARRLMIQDYFYGKGYMHEVSFVGSMYNGSYNFYDQINYLPEYIKGFLEGVMEAQRQIYGYDFLDKLLDREKMNEIFRYVNIDLGEEYFREEKNVFLDILHRKMTAVERLRLMERISECFDTVIYCQSATPEIPKVKNMGYAEYMREMPEVFRRSKINLNITMRSILSGIPLRVFDICGAGGFVLSNYQSELPEHFLIGEEIELYGSEEECVDKIAFYLEHEEAREKIAERGCRKVRREFSYEKQFGKMFHTVGLN